MMILIPYTVACVVLAHFAAKKGGAFWDSFFISFALTPLALINRLMR